MTAATWGRSPAAVGALADLRIRVAAGAPVGDVSGLPVRVRSAVTLAEETGAPLLPVVASAIAGLEDDRRRDRALRVATAQTRAVTTGLVALPVVLVPMLARLLDLDVGAFYATTAGRAVLTVALGLLATGGGLVHVAVRRARRPPDRRRTSRPGVALLAGAVVGSLTGPIGGVLATAGVAVATSSPRRASLTVADRDEAADLLAVALEAGLSASAACRAAAAVARPPVAVALRHLALALVIDGPGVADLSAHAEVLRSSGAWGSPAAPALRSLARDLRAEALADALAAAERLPAQLTVPTALCFLPASVLLIGAPLVAEGIGAVAGVR